MRSIDQFIIKLLDKLATGYTKGDIKVPHVTSPGVIRHMGTVRYIRDNILEKALPTLMLVVKNHIHVASASLAISTGAVQTHIETHTIYIAA